MKQTTLDKCVFGVKSIYAKHDMGIACPVCFYTVSRDVAAAQVIRNRGLEIISGSGSGHDLEIKQIVCGLDAAGISVTSLAGTGRSRKLKK